MMIIDHLKIATNDQAAIESAFQDIEPQIIAYCNWPVQYPYTPEVQFRIFHTGELLFLRFDVKEQYTKGEVTEDNGAVWTDSCVEFFLELDDLGYYNFEATCIGTLLVGFRKERENAEHATTHIMSQIKRTASLGCEPFAERVGDNCWSLTLAIPPTALFRHKIKSWSGVQARANLYKCGDGLSHPHFLSWQAIENPNPDFHLPQFFENIKFK